LQRSNILLLEKVTTLILTATKYGLLSLLLNVGPFLSENREVSLEENTFFYVHMRVEKSIFCKGVSEIYCLKPIK